MICTTAVYDLSQILHYPMRLTISLERHNKTWVLGQLNPARIRSGIQQYSPKYQSISGHVASPFHAARDINKHQLIDFS